MIWLAGPSLLTGYPQRQTLRRVSQTSLPLQSPKTGVVYTRAWVVELMLDLAGYVAEVDLYQRFAVEPSAGDGAFLASMIRRLAVSCRLHGRSLASACDAIRAYEIDEEVAYRARSVAKAELHSAGCTLEEATALSQVWVRSADFLECTLGFPTADFVVGNPPYIRLEDLPPSKNFAYRSAYSAMGGRADVYVAFYQAALTQLKAGGVCSFICADRWFLNEYGARLREFISNGFAVTHIIDMHDVSAFESMVSAYPAITVIRNQRQGAVVTAKALPGIESISTSEIISKLINNKPSALLPVAYFTKWFRGSEPWVCSSQESNDLLEILEDQFEPLESESTGTRIGIGVATGADRVFIVRELPDIEKDRLLKLAMAGDVEKSQVSWSGNYLINPWDRNGLVDLGEHPKLARYLKSHEILLRSRHVAKGRSEKWHRTIDRVSMQLADTQKLYIPDIKGQLQVALDCGETYPHHNLYWITSKHWDLEVLGGLLLSEVPEYFVRSYGVKMRGGYFRFQAQYLRRIRVPNPRTISLLASENLRIAFRTRNRTLANSVALELYGISTIPDRHLESTLPRSRAILLGQAPAAAG